MMDLRFLSMVRKAFLIGTYFGSKERSICEEHLEELSLLAKTHGLETLAKEVCPLRQINASTFIGEGKLEELKELSKDADIIIFDEEMTPAQQRNLEKAFQKPVMDRAELILAVFADRAQTKEAALQVELARIKYQRPRLKRLWTHLSRQMGSGGAGAYVKGEGEKQIELDRRMLDTRIERLQKDIQEVELHRRTQRSQREKSGIPVFAIVGYTNAGKSTLLNALTDAGVFVEDKLFATLDTTTRKYHLPNNQEVLLIDTVGFIRKLPHLLVAAFKSTLEEAIQADILLHLIDVTHPMAFEQAAASIDVLKELGAFDKPMITVLNKMDKLTDPSVVLKFRTRYPHVVTISAQTGEGFDELIEKMIAELRKRRSLVWLKIPQEKYHLVTEVLRSGTVLDQEYEGNDVILRAELPLPLVGRLKEFICEEHPS